MLITPVLHFAGQCEEAIALYQQAFGARIAYLAHYSDAKPEDSPDIPVDQKNFVYHAEVYIGAQRLMMADEPEQAQAASTASFLCVTLDTPEQVKAAYEALLPGGTVIYPLHSTTYSTATASLVDRFGKRWGVMTEMA